MTSDPSMQIFRIIQFQLPAYKHFKSFETSYAVQKYMSLVMRKPAFCICKNKDADQLRSNREADQRLCFRYMDSATPLLSISEISSLYPFSMTVQPDLCPTWSETPKTGFLTTRLICALIISLKDDEIIKKEIK